MINRNILPIGGKQLISNKAYTEAMNVIQEIGRVDRGRGDIKETVKKLADAHKKVRKLTYEEYLQIPLRELKFTNKADEKMLRLQLMILHSGYVRSNNKVGSNDASAIIRTKNLANDLDFCAIDIFSGADKMDVGKNRKDANFKYWCDGYVLLLYVSTHYDEFCSGLEETKGEYQDWIENLREVCRELAEGNRYKGIDKLEHMRHYSSFGSYVGITISESIPSIWEIEVDEEISAAVEKIHSKFTQRQAKRIDLDYVISRFQTSDDLSDEMKRLLPHQINRNYVELGHYYDFDLRKFHNERADYYRYGKDEEYRKKVHTKFIIHIIPRLRDFIIINKGKGGNLDTFISEHRHLFAEKDTMKIMSDIQNKVEPNISIYNTILAMMPKKE